MFDWIAESFGMLFGGLASLVSGIIRIGLIVIVIAIIVQYVRALMENPVAWIRGTIGVGLAIIIGFGIPIFVLGDLPEGSFLVVWPLGWILAYWVGSRVGGFSDENDPVADKVE